MTPPERLHASAIIDTATKKTTIFFLFARWRSLGDRELFTMPIPALGINASRSERPAVTIRSASGQNSDSSMSMSLINSQPPGSEGQVLGLVRMLGLVRARRDALKRTGSLTTTLRPSAALRRLASLLLPLPLLPPWLPRSASTTARRRPPPSVRRLGSVGPTR